MGGGNLVGGRTRSCGCFNLETLSRSGSAVFCARDTKRHPEYKVWLAMISRCHEPDNRQFPDYGARGIAVCDRWRIGENGVHGFNLFMLDMGSRPSDKHTIDRIDNDRGYSPDNCAWRTRTEQARNRRNTVMVHYNGASIPLAAACELAGLPYEVVKGRLWDGWSLDRALSQPVEEKKPPTRNPTVTYRGEVMPIAKACEFAGLPLLTVRMRLHRGWPEELALSQPVRIDSRNRNA